MKKLFFNGIVLLVLFTISLSIISFTNLRNIKPLDKENFITDSVTILAIGDSHIQYALRDNSYPELLNIAKGGEGYLFNNAKFRLFNSSEIKHVILAFNYFSLTGGDKPGEITDASIIRTYLPVLNLYPDFFEKSGLNLKNKAYLSSYLNLNLGFPSKEIFNDFFQGGLNGNNISFVGGYENYFNSNINKLTDVKNRHDRLYGNYSIGNYNLELLRSFIKEMNENNIEVILYNAPCHHLFINLTSEIHIRKMDSIAFSLCKDYNARYINHYDLNLPDSCFTDFDHLNSHGADIVTPILIDIIKGSSKIALKESNH